MTLANLKGKHAESEEAQEYAKGIGLVEAMKLGTLNASFLRNCLQPAQEERQSSPLASPE